MARYRPRLIDPVIDDVVKELPALLIVGPRATGKTTTALRHAKTVVRLDRPAEAENICVPVRTEHAPVSSSALASAARASA